MIRTLILIGAVALFIWNPYPLQYLELKGYDTLIMSTETIQNENILIVDLDEDLVKAYEGYPLPRSLYAELITKTNAVPGITVLMPDPDIRGKENDLLLSNTMRKVPPDTEKLPPKSRMAIAPLEFEDASPSVLL